MANLSMTRDEIHNQTHDFLPYYHVALQPSPTDPEKTFVRDCVTINPLENPTQEMNTRLLFYWKMVSFEYYFIILP